MQAENMKLLDLQTGKYLELGKDWGYFGEFILLNLGSAIELTIKEWGSVSYGDNAYGWHGYIGQAIKQPHADPIVNDIAEKVGAVIYGGRYVLLSSEQDTSIHDDNHCYKNGDVVRSGHGHGYVAICTASTHYSYHQNVLDIPNFQDSCEAGFLWSKYEILGNIFEEYSKQLRNEPNKFDELNELLK